jgi:hypothetical protein
MHIITLGEGADQTYVFYGADYPAKSATARSST